jgi:hypothetical protein
MPTFADYHRTVIGYHGTRRSTALRIIQGLEAFKRSENADDWLGHGIYFWEHAPKQAWAWARQRQRGQKWNEEIAVLASMIRLGDCFDLLDPDNLQELAGFEQDFVLSEQRAGRSVPRNRNKSKYYDCAVLQFAYSRLERQSNPVDTCRAVFVPSAQRLWLFSGLYRNAHIQLCIRNAACILGTWLVSPTEERSHGIL